MCELVMETTNDNAGYDPLQYHAVNSVPQPFVYTSGVGTVNQAQLYYTAMVAQADDCQLDVCCERYESKSQN